jgi:3-phosphoshikimate 1-carboxyvinyltransferase
LSRNEFLRISGERPKNFYGTLSLPPSKSYLHRALFIASLCRGKSKIFGLGEDNLSDDVVATIRALNQLGVKTDVKRYGVIVKSGPLSGSSESIFVGGSGTTARFAISFAALANDGSRTIITGDSSLSKRPMQQLLDALKQLGVECHSQNSNGRLPVVVEGKGIDGGNCTVDGSVSSQFVSSLLIACVRARKDTTITIADPSKLVSEPYVDATLAVLKHFGFVIQTNKLKFKIKGNQEAHGKNFKVPGDMSSGASLIAAAIACKGRLRLLGVNLKLPQSDAEFIKIARKFGAIVSVAKNSILVNSKQTSSRRGMTFNMKDSPDLVPMVTGLASAIGRGVKITNVAHLRFKESDRLSTMSRELQKLGIRTKETSDSITIFARGSSENAIDRRKPILLHPENDHRIMMAVTVAGLSGKFGEVLISDPSCVSKSYPNFVSDVNQLLHQKGILELVKRGGRN